MECKRLCPAHFYEPFNEEPVFKSFSTFHFLSHPSYTCPPSIPPSIESARRRCCLYEVSIPSFVHNEIGMRSRELQIIVSFNKPDRAQALYKERWQIESAFKALKTSGFNIEDTHLTDIERVSKLLSLVLIAFAWVYRVGIYLDTLKPIKIKKHGRRAKSLFKYGLTYIANLLFSNDIDNFKQCCKFLSCT